MARTPLLFACSLTLFGAIALAWPGAAVAASAADPSAAVEDLTYAEFRTEFDKANAINARQRMEELVKDHQRHTIDLLASTAEAIGNAPNEVLLNRFGGLRTAWKARYSTDFPDKLERFFARLPSSVKAERLKLREQYDEATRKISALESEKAAEALALAVADMEGIGDAFSEMGDKYYASQAYFWGAIAGEERNQGKDADLHKVADLYAKFMENRAAFDLKDRHYGEVETRLRTLTAQGYGGKAAGSGEGGEGAAAGPAGPKTRGPVVKADLTFELLEIMDDLERPNYYLDEHRQIWPAVQLKAVGSQASIPRIDDGPTIIRESSAKIMVDSDHDGKGDLEWPTRGKFEILTLTLGEGETERQWAVLTEVGRQEDFYQGQPMNLLAQDASYDVYYTPASKMAGTIDGVEIEIFDDNLDGVYGSYPLSWQHAGLVPESPQPELDSIRIGGEKSARPFSEYVQLDKKGWYRLNMLKKGKTIEAQPMDLKTGTLQLDVKGVKPDFLIIKGSKGDFENTYVDLAGGKKVEVPVGRYQLAFGLVRKGKKMQLSKAAILPTKDSPIYTVLEGENVEVQIGAPYMFDFAYEKSGDKVLVDGESIRVVGRGGEAYDRFYNAVPRPEAGVRKKGGRRAEVKEKMKPVVDLDGLAKHGWAAMWKPLDVELKAPAAEVEVQLVEKKNKLFGKVESDWR